MDRSAIVIAIQKLKEADSLTTGLYVPGAQGKFHKARELQRDALNILRNEICDQKGQQVMVL